MPKEKKNIKFKVQSKTGVTVIQNGKNVHLEYNTEGDTEKGYNRDMIIAMSTNGMKLKNAKTKKYDLITEPSIKVLN